MSDQQSSQAHTILVIGEQSGFVDQLAAALEEDGFRFCAPQTSDALLDEIRRLGPDCVILSERLTTRQALDLCSTIRTAFDGSGLSYVPLLYLHGGRGVKPRLEAVRSGADAVQQKPFDRQEVMLRLQYLCGLKRRMEQATEPLPEDKRFLDDQTGFYNRNYLVRRLQEEFKRVERFKEPLSCIVAEVDGLQAIERKTGLFERDAAIESVSRVLAKTSRGNNILAHVAEGRFGILLPNSEVSGAIAFAERVRESIQTHFAGRERFTPPLTITLGISCYPHNHLERPEQLLALAESALVSVQKMGRNRYFLCSQKNNLEFISSSMRWKPKSHDRPSRRRTSASQLVPQVNQYQLAGAASALLRALGLHDQASRTRCRHTALYAVELGRRLLSKPQSIRVLKYSALLHDLGSIGGPGESADTPGTDRIERGVEILRPLGLPEEALRIIRHQGERFDGSGTPHRLHGREIPLGSRILALCRTFDLLTGSHLRPESEVLEAAADKLEHLSGNQLDPELVKILLANLDSIAGHAAEQGAGDPDSVEELLLRKTDYPYPKPIARRRNYRLLKNNGE
jgi:two-component system cell cycle response regulator